MLQGALILQATLMPWGTSGLASLMPRGAAATGYDALRWPAPLTGACSERSLL